MRSLRSYRNLRCQKAPSTKRRIKTSSSTQPNVNMSGLVRKHRAPKGALRLGFGVVLGVGLGDVRKHRAPKGALRLSLFFCMANTLRRQKAPSAKRCIKTRLSRSSLRSRRSVRKHRAPKGALRHLVHRRTHHGHPVSESTERQKVH